MTKKDFIRLAATLKATMPAPHDGPASLIQWRRDVEGITNVCATSNPHFDRVKFLRACGVVA